MDPTSIPKLTGCRVGAQLTKGAPTMTETITALANLRMCETVTAESNVRNGWVADLVLARTSVEATTGHVGQGSDPLADRPRFKHSNASAGWLSPNYYNGRPSLGKEPSQSLPISAPPYSHVALG